MTDSGSTHSHHEEGAHPGHPQESKPWWMRVHRDWRFWAAVLFIAAALFVYITSVDLSLVPGRHHRQHETLPVGE
jgi:hypothetical protein